MECKNCKNALLPQSKFCNNCGGKVIANRLTFRNIIEDFSEQFLNYDNRFLQTFINLFKQPEDVIDTYINGTRKKYVHVLNYIALAITVSGLQFFILNKFYPGAMDFPEYVAKDNPFGNSIMSSIFEYYSLLYILLIPVYAFVSMLVFYNIKKYNYVEHIVILGYTQSQLSISLFIPTLILSALGYSFFDYNYYYSLVMVIYSAYCFKRLYQLSLKRIIVKSVVFLFIGFGIYIVLIIIFMIIMMAYLFLTGGMEEFMEAQKAANKMGYMASSVINWTS